jgi:hypothetical protein
MDKPEIKVFFLHREFRNRQETENSFAPRNFDAGKKKRFI